MKDVTKGVKFELNDADSLPLLQCTCGQKFDEWEHVIGLYPHSSSPPCPKCGSVFVFKLDIKIFKSDTTGEAALFTEKKEVQQ
jgi:hypothetical protein